MTVRPKPIPQIKDRMGGCVGHKCRDGETHPSRLGTRVICLACCFACWNLCFSGERIRDHFLPTRWRPLERSLLWVKVSNLTSPQIMLVRGERNSELNLHVPLTITELEAERFDSIGASFNSLIDLHYFGLIFFSFLFFFSYFVPPSPLWKEGKQMKTIIFSFAGTKMKAKKDSDIGKEIFHQNQREWL